MFDRSNISSFLFFGYCPKIPSTLDTKVWALASRNGNSPLSKDDTEKDLIKNGVRALQSIFTNVGNGEHIVPLSGGLDSRTILGGLLVAGLKDRITAVTFGTPGTFDYDIGCAVARQVGVRHKSFDLTQVKIEQDTLEETAREMETRAWIFDAFYRRLIHKRFGKDAIYWSGFMGDALSGRHQILKENVTCEEAISNFIECNRFVKSIDLTNPGFDPADVLPRPPFLRDSILNYDRQMEFVLRQESYIRHIVAPTYYDYRTPFLQPEWVKFILNVPRKFLRNQYLYRKILATAFPDLFSLPTKNSCGLPLTASNWRIKLKKGFWKIKNAIHRRFPFWVPHCNPWINYIDFDEAIRQRKDLKELVSRNIYDLKKRGIIDWVDIECLWMRHQQRRVNCADAITLLVSLEIILRVDEEGGP